MNPSAVFRLLGLLNFLLAGSMVLPLAVNYIYGEPHARAYLLSIGLTASAGLLLVLLFGKSSRELSHRDGFAVVALGWVQATLFGALPYLLTGAFPSLADACFETASGFTTTGSTVMADIAANPRAILFWRALTQWLGGMGIILLSLAILPLLGIGGMQLYRAEVPGPTADKIRPRVSQTARILWQVYLLLSAAEAALLLLGGMDLFDALCHTFATMATGGFSPKNESVEFFRSPFLEYTVTFFMFVAGANFSLHFRFLRGDPRALFRDPEFRFYCAAALVFTLLIAWDLRGAGLYRDFADCFRLALFQTVSIQTTTGFTTADYEKWPAFSQTLIFLLMFVGGCAGSTGGGIKCVRILILLKHASGELKQLIHPHALIPVKLGNKLISPDTLRGVWGLFFLYLSVFALASAGLAFLGIDLTTAFAAAATTLGNIGPGFFGVGPADNFAHLSAPAKWILTFCMLCGRLEIYTLLILLSPEFWRK